MTATASTIGHTTEMAEALVTILAAKALGHFKSNTVLARLVARDFEFTPARKGQTVRITKRGTLTAEDKTEHQEVTLQQPVLGNYDVTLNKHKHTSFLIEDFARALIEPNYLNGYIEDAAKVISEKVDYDIATLYSGLSQSIDCTGAKGPVASEDFIEARRLLNAAKAPLGERYAVMHEDADADYLSLEEATNMSYAASLGGALADAYGGRFGGFHTFMDREIRAVGSVCENLFFHKYAMVLATRPLDEVPDGLGVVQRVMQEDGLGLRVTIGYSQQFLGMQCTVDLLYGVAEMLDTFGVVVKTDEK